jgi:hypothetical protein
VKQYILKDSYKRSRGTYCLHLLGTIVMSSTYADILGYHGVEHQETVFRLSTLNMEAEGTSIIWYIFTKLYGVISQKTVTVRTSDLTRHSTGRGRNVTDDLTMQ